MWVLYILYYLTMIFSVPSYLTGVSLFFLCFDVAVHILFRESVALWFVTVVVEVILFVYSSLLLSALTPSYLCLFPFFRSKIFVFTDINPTEFGIFMTNDIMSSVVTGNVFFYLLRFFIRITIGCSRILFFSVVPARSLDP